MGLRQGRYRCCRGRVYVIHATAQHHGRESLFLYLVWADHGQNGQFRGRFKTRGGRSGEDPIHAYKIDQDQLTMLHHDLDQGVGALASID